VPARVQGRQPRFAQPQRRGGSGARRRRSAPRGRGSAPPHEPSHVWFVDPEARTLEILEKDERGYRVFEVFSGDAKVRAVPFDAIELELWAR